MTRLPDWRWSSLQTWLTAFQLLHLVGRVQSGEFVLIHAGASGVGLAAVQLAKAAGAKPLVTAGSAEKVAAAVRLGALGGADRHEGLWAEKIATLTSGEGVSLILDCVGASYWEMNAEVLAVDGRWVLYGLLGGPNVEGPILGKLLRKRVQLLATTLRARPLKYRRELVRRFTEEALPSLGDGSFRYVCFKSCDVPVIYTLSWRRDYTLRCRIACAHYAPLSPCYNSVVVDTVFPLAEAAAAHAMMEANKNTGKIVLRVTDETGTKNEL